MLTYDRGLKLGDKPVIPAHLTARVRIGQLEDSEPHTVGSET